MNLVYKAARDFITPEVDRVLIDDAEEFEKVRDFMRLLGPQYVERIEHYNGGRELFDDFKIDEELQKLMRPKINLPSGGSIVIETTEALTVIDVNCGKFTGGNNLEDTIVKTNIEAAAEIARQVRLRDIGGIIVVRLHRYVDRVGAQQGDQDARRRPAQRPHAHDDPIVLDSRPARVHAQARRQGSRRRSCAARARRAAASAASCRPRSVAIETFRDDPPHRHEQPTATPSSEPIDVRRRADRRRADRVLVRGRMRQLSKRARHARSTSASIRRCIPRSTRRRARRRRRSAELARTTCASATSSRSICSTRACRSPTSALAIVGDRLVEVENAANAAGQTVKIKIIDIDEDGTILAEPRDAGRRGQPAGEASAAAAAAAAAEAAHRRRTGRTTARTGRGGRQGRRRAAGASASPRPPRPSVKRPRPTRPRAPPIAVSLARARPRRRTSRVARLAGADGEPRRRRRRRRRRRGNGEGAVTLAGFPPERRAPDRRNRRPPTPATTQPTRPPRSLAGAGSPEENGTRRRRRRRRRRGRGAGGEAVQGPGPRRSPSGTSSASAPRAKPSRPAGPLRRNRRAPSPVDRRSPGRSPSSRRRRA